MGIIDLLSDIEIINISTKEGKLVALLSYNDTDKDHDGYDTIEVPINIRDIQVSSRGNMLVDQSLKLDSCESSS